MKAGGRQGRGGIDEIQDLHERAVGQAFLTWLNAHEKARFVVAGRAGEAPDLVLRDGDRELRAEVTTVYYDTEHARFLWMPARGRPDTPRVWAGVLLEEKLLENTNLQLKQKCAADYGRDCVPLLRCTPP